MVTFYDVKLHFPVSIQTAHNVQAMSLLSKLEHPFVIMFSSAYNNLKTIICCPSSMVICPCCIQNTFCQGNLGVCDAFTSLPLMILWVTTGVRIISCTFQIVRIVGRDVGQLRNASQMQER